MCQDSFWWYSPFSDTPHENDFISSDPHPDTLMVTNVKFSDIVSDIQSESIYSVYIYIYILTFYLTFFQELSGIYSDILFDFFFGIILSGFFSDILSGICSGIGSRRTGVQVQTLPTCLRQESVRVGVAPWLKSRDPHLAGGEKKISTRHHQDLGYHQ